MKGKPMSRLFSMAIMIGTLAGCQTARPPASSADVHATMVGGIDPAAVVIWSVGSRAMSQASGSRQRVMDEPSWAKLEAAALQLEFHSRRLARARAIDVGIHDERLGGFANGTEVQARIDADPDEFRNLAEAAAIHAANLAVAARSRDINRSELLTRNLYDNCLACHSKYWDQPGH